MVVWRFNSGGVAVTKCLGCLGVVRYLDSIMYYTKQRIIFEGISWLFNDKD